MFGLFEEDEEKKPKTSQIPDFSKIENPKVREYMQAKYAKEQELAEAKDKRDIGAYGDIAGKFLEGMSTPTNIRYENSFGDLGKAPQRSVGPSFKYDDGGAKEFIEKGVREAEAGVAKTKQDFNDSVQMENYSRQEADYGDENDPNSEQSKQYQMLAKKFVPGGNYAGLSAAKIKKLIPPLQAAYEIDAKKRANVQQGSWSSTGQSDSEGYLILMDKNGNTKRGPKVGVKAGSDKLSQEAQGAEASFNAKSTKLDNLEKLYEGTNWNGPVSGRIGSALNTLGTGTGSNEFDTLNQNVMSLASSYIKEMSGTAAGEKEMQRLSQVMPRPSDSDSVAKIKIKELRREARAIANEFREKKGWKPLPEEGSPQDQIQQFQQNNGQTQIPAAPKPSWAK